MINVKDTVEIAYGDAILIFLQETNARTVCLADTVWIVKKSVQFIVEEASVTE